MWPPHRCRFPVLAAGLQLTVLVTLAHNNYSKISENVSGTLWYDVLKILCLQVAALVQVDVRSENVNRAERQNFPLIAQLHFRESGSPLRSAPTTSRSRSAHAALDFLNPTHRSAPLKSVFGPFRSVSAPLTCSGQVKEQHEIKLDCSRSSVSSSGFLPFCPLSRSFVHQLGGTLNIPIACQNVTCMLLRWQPENKLGQN